MVYKVFRKVFIFRKEREGRETMLLLGRIVIEENFWALFARVQFSHCSCKKQARYYIIIMDSCNTGSYYS